MKEGTKHLLYKSQKYSDAVMAKERKVHLKCKKSNILATGASKNTIK